MGNRITMVRGIRTGFPIDPNFFGQSTGLSNFLFSSPNYDLDLYIAVPRNKDYFEYCRELLDRKGIGLLESDFDHSYIDYVAGLTNGPLVIHESDLFRVPRYAEYVKKRHPNIKTIVHLHNLLWVMKDPLHVYVEDSVRTQRIFDEREQSMREAVGNGYIDAFIAVSPIMIEDYARAGLIDSNRTYVVRNGVCTDLYSPVTRSEVLERRSQLGLECAKLFGFVGRLDVYKGCDVLLQMIIQAQRYPDLGFLIVTGDHEKMRRFADELRLLTPDMIDGNRVKVVTDFSQLTFHYGLTQTDIERVYSIDTSENSVFTGITTRPPYQLFDVNILPSRHDAFSNVLLEATSCGVPSVVTNVGSSREIVGEHGVVLSPLTDNDHISTRAAEFLEACFSLMGRHPEPIRNSIFERGLTAQQFVENTIKVYESLF